MWLLWLLIKYLILGHPPTKGGYSSTLDDIYIYIEKQRLASTCTATLLQSHALGFLLVDLEYCQPFHSYFSHASWCKLSIYSPWLPQAQMICIIFAGYVSQIRSQIFFRAPLQCLWARSWRGQLMKSVSSVTKYCTSLLLPSQSHSGPSLPLQRLLGRPVKGEEDCFPLTRFDSSLSSAILWIDVSCDIAISQCTYAMQCAVIYLDTGSRTIIINCSPELMLSCLVATNSGERDGSDIATDMKYGVASSSG